MLLIKRQIKFAKKGTKGLGVDVVAPVLLGEGWNKLSDELKKAYTKLYQANWKFFDLLYQDKKYGSVFAHPVSHVIEDNPQSETTEIVEPSKLVPRTNVKKGANNSKWSYQRLRAAELFGRSDLNTAEGVALFLASHNLKADGMLGKDTLKVLNSLYNKNINLSLISYKPLEETKPKKEVSPEKTLLEIVLEKYPTMGWTSDDIIGIESLEDFEKYNLTKGFWIGGTPLKKERNKLIYKNNGRTIFGTDGKGNSLLYSSDGSVTWLDPETINGKKYYTWTHLGNKYGYDPETKKTYKLSNILKIIKVLKPKLKSAQTIKKSGVDFALPYRLAFK